MSGPRASRHAARSATSGASNRTERVPPVFVSLRPSSLCARSTSSVRPRTLLHGSPSAYCARSRAYARSETSVASRSWPQGSRVIVRRERPHPGAQLSFTDHDGYRFQAILTDQPDENIAIIECRHRQHAHVENRIRDDKDTGLSKFPFKAFALNEVWLEIVMLAHDLLAWTQALLLDEQDMLRALTW
jgi:hypothetical protein